MFVRISIDQIADLDDFQAIATSGELAPRKEQNHEPTDLRAPDPDPPPDGDDEQVLTRPGDAAADPDRRRRGGGAGGAVRLAAVRLLREDPDVSATASCTTPSPCATPRCASPGPTRPTTSRASARSSTARAPTPRWSRSSSTTRRSTSACRRTQIHFNGPYKPESALEKALPAGAMIHIDHFDELALAEKVAEKHDIRPKVALRLNLTPTPSPPGAASASTWRAARPGRGASA